MTAPAALRSQPRAVSKATGNKKLCECRKPGTIIDPGCRAFSEGSNPDDSVCSSTIGRHLDGLDDAELRVIGEVPASVAEYFDVQPGEILCVMAVT